LTRRGFIGGGIADQAFSSLTTLVVSLSVLATAPIGEAQDFSVLVLTFGILVALARSVTSEPAIVFSSLQTDASRGRLDGSHLVQSLIIGAAGTALACALFGIGGSFGILVAGACFLAVGADSVRTGLQALGKTTNAAAITGSTFVAVGISGALAVFLDEPSVVIGAWAGASGLAIAAGFIIAGHTRLWGAFKPETYSFFAEAIVTTGASQGAVLVGAALLDPNLAVVARVGATIFGPYLAVYQATALLAIPYFRRHSPHSGPRVQAAVVSAALLLVLVVSALPTILVLNAVGEKLLSDSWTSFEPFLPAYLASLIAGTLTAGVFLAVRATGRTRQSLWLRIASGSGQLAVPFLALAGGGMDTYFIFATLVIALVAVLGWAMLARGGQHPTQGLRRTPN
jgi:hypothetical protein